MGYEPVARLGVGGMGVVDLGRAPDGTLVALKRLTLRGSADDIARARLRTLREAEVLTRLDHPNIVELLEVLGDGDDVVLVMRYLTGGTVADRVTARGPVPAADVEVLADRLGSALAEAHRAGIVHRDLKPANVLFDDHDVPHLADFGVASSRDDTAGLTLVGTVVGTPAYMAPEQARGEPAGQAADVFALGATLLYALTGEGPYGRGASALLMVRAAQGRIRAIPRSIPAPLRLRLQAMLDPQPQRRPTAAALVGGPAGTSVQHPVRRAPRRWTRVLGAATVSVALLAALVAAAAWARPQRAEGEVSGATTTTSGCEDLPYQPCGTAPAAGTDGRDCLVGAEDYDGDRANGCEARVDDLTDDAELADGAGVGRGTIVPRDDVDTFSMPVGDGLQLLCDGRFTVTLTAPVGMTLRLELLDGDVVVAVTTSADGIGSAVHLDERDCIFSEARTIVARVSPVGSDRTGAEYELERSGSF